VGGLVRLTRPPTPHKKLKKKNQKSPPTQNNQTEQQKKPFFFFFWGGLFGVVCLGGFPGVVPPLYLLFRLVVLPLDPPQDQTS